MDATLYFIFGPLQLSHVHNSYLGAVTLWDWICEFHSYCHLTNVFWLDSWRRISFLFIRHSTNSKNIEWNHLFHLNSSRLRRQGHSSNWLICKSHRQDSTHKDIWEQNTIISRKKDQHWGFLKKNSIFDHKIQDSTSFNLTDISNHRISAVCQCSPEEKKKEPR